jgi:RNA polymerase sigma factor (TIGR02999 family)
VAGAISPGYNQSTMATSLTRLLQDSPAEDPQRAQQIFAIAYSELRRLAASMLRSQRAGHTLQATALVHEAYLKLLGGDQAAFDSRAHFFAVAAKAMRQILVDHARRHLSQKRGGGAQRMELKEGIAYSAGNASELLALHTALDALGEFDGRKAQVIEMRFFAGMTAEEIAAALSVSKPTVTRDLRVAQAWLAAHLGAEAADGEDV